MIYADRNKPLDIPKAVAKCPDCGKGLWIQIEEWEPTTGEVTEEGYEIHCKEENKTELHYFGTDLCFGRWVNEWLPVQAKIYAWLTANVRVAQATKADLERWAEAVKDWRVVA